jgi:hypothetical protein
MCPYPDSFTGSAAVYYTDLLVHAANITMLCMLQTTCYRASSSQYHHTVQALPTWESANLATSIALYYLEGLRFLESKARARMCDLF